MNKKLILIDGNSLVYRAFFALPTSLTTADGRVTNAVYGFTSMLLKLMKDEKPDTIGVAFDRGPSFRKEHFADYKAHRPDTPDDLPHQFQLVKDVLAALKIPIFELPGYEADDVLASLAKQAGGKGDEILVVTGDKDAFQLVTDGIRIMTTRKGISDIVLYDREKVIERYGIPPEHVRDYLALKGDPSDNIPGVPGVGEKTAAKLIQEFGTVEEIYERVEEIKSERLRKNLVENEAEARLSKKLATLEMDLPLEIDIDEFKLGQWDENEVRHVFAALEFTTLLDRFLGTKQMKSREAVAPEKTELKALTAENLSEFLDSLNELRYSLAVRSDGTFKDQRVSSIAFGFPGEKAAFLLELPDREKERAAIFAILKPALEDIDSKKVVHDVKSAALALFNDGVFLAGVEFDVYLAAYLDCPEKGKYPVEELALSYLDRQMPEDIMGSGLGSQAVAVLDLYEVLHRALKEKDMLPLLQKVEIPLAYVLAKLEKEGVGINVGHFERLSKELELMLCGIEQEIFALAEEEFNIASPQQLGRILFEKLGLPSDKRTKTGYSTDIRVLTKLINAHPIIEKIITFRELAKLKSTYVDSLPKLINPRTKRLHTTFNQAGTSTGRLSSHDPNLQNIPIRTELGLRIREGFVPTRASDFFISADYSQIELRLLAHFSEDPLLMEAFETGIDVHSSTAQQVFGALPEQVTTQMRRIAKMINFGVLYGMSPFGLADRLNISQREAKDYIDRYFARYSGVKEFVDRTISETAKRGYTLTILGRRRPVPELTGRDKRLRGFGERLAVNAPLQGSAADIIKLAMLKLDNELEERALTSRLVLQVHDELILEVPREELATAKETVRDVMESVYPLKVPLEVEVSEGKNWKEAK